MSRALKDQELPPGAFFADVLAALPISLKYFAGLQTVFGAVFFFLLALGLRNRFRLK